MKKLRNFPPLYGLDTHGNVKIWQISVDIRDNYPAVIVSHGKHGGKLQETYTLIKEGKNVGRLSGTTPEMQAYKEADSKFKRQIKKGYSETIPEEDLIRGPMLAQNYRHNSHKAKWPSYAQPKINGLRCLARYDDDDRAILKSRGNEIFKALGHIRKEVDRHLPLGQELDGEIYSPDFTFEQIQSFAMKKSFMTPRLKYFIYDMPSEDPFALRYENYTEFLEKIDSDILIPVPCELVNNEDEFFELHEKYVADGWEGSILRDPAGKYRYSHKVPQLLKYKDVEDDEFEIIGGEEGVGKSAGQCTFICKTAEGKEFHVRCKGENAVREEQWKNLPNYIGKFLKVEFKEYTPDGIPREPVGIGIREEWDMPAEHEKVKD